MNLKEKAKHLKANLRGISCSKRKEITASRADMAA
jgi:hypothetical protein